MFMILSKWESTFLVLLGQWGVRFRVLACV